MKKQKIFPTIFVLLVTVLCVVGAINGLHFAKELRYELGFNVEAKPAPDPLNAELAHLVLRYRRGEISAIEISSITTFSWDHLYIFGNYARASDVDPIVGKSWRDIPRCAYALSVIPTSDSNDLLVFTHEKKVVHCMLNSTWPRFGVFDTAHVSGITREKAIFKIVTQNNEWLVIQ